MYVHIWDMKDVLLMAKPCSIFWDYCHIYTHTHTHTTMHISLYPLVDLDKQIFTPVFLTTKPYTCIVLVTLMKKSIYDYINEMMWNLFVLALDWKTLLFMKGDI